MAVLILFGHFYFFSCLPAGVDSIYLEIFDEVGILLFTLFRPVIHSLCPHNIGTDKIGRF